MQREIDPDLVDVLRHMLNRQLYRSTDKGIEHLSIRDLKTPSEAVSVAFNCHGGYAKPGINYMVFYSCSSVELVYDDKNKKTFTRSEMTAAAALVLQEHKGIGKQLQLAF